MNEVDLSKENNAGLRVLLEASRKLVPWWTFKQEDILDTQTETDPTSYLDSYYLFPLDEISVHSECEDVSQFICERIHNVLAAASHSSVSVALILSQKKGISKIFLGFKNDSSQSYSAELFESIVNGILPGKKIAFQESMNMSDLVDGYNFGGMITGVPTLDKHYVKQKFNLSSVSRSLYGQDYFLAILSRPVPEVDKQKSFNELIQIRDLLHSIAKQTIGGETSVGTSLTDTQTTTLGNSKTSGQGAGGSGGIGFPTPFGFIGFGGNYSQNWSDTVSESKSIGTATARTQQQSQSLSIEHQNGYALELEKIAEQHIRRMIQGFGSGYWETSITFATPSRITGDILAGSLVGEISRPNTSLLPPPRVFIDALKGRKLFIPKFSSSGEIFPKVLASYITSEELSLVSSPPAESIPGYEIQKMPMLSLSDSHGEQDLAIGNIADCGRSVTGSSFCLSKRDLNKHVFVCGLTGSGKTTTIKHILMGLVSDERTPFLVLESAKRDYRQLLANNVFKKNLNVFTIGNATVSPIHVNPFYVQAGVHPLEHIDYLKALIIASFSLYGPMPSIIEKCLHAIYIKKGWDLTLGVHPFFLDKVGSIDKERYSIEEHYYCFPTLTDLKDEVSRYVKSELGYKGELRDNICTAIIVRLESLCIGAKGLMFNTHDFFPINDLLGTNTILEMEGLADDDDKAFFVGLILVLIREHRQQSNPAINPGSTSRGLRHLIVIEEAHRLLQNINTERQSDLIGNPKGKAVEVFCNILAEMRSLGQGVAVVEQIPSKISPDVIKNSNTKIIHRIVSRDDQALVAGSLGIDADDALYLNRLKTGYALCHKEGMGKPVECAVTNDVESHAISDDNLRWTMKQSVPDALHKYQSYQLNAHLGQAGRELVLRFFNSLVLTRPRELPRLLTIAELRLRQTIALTCFHNQLTELCASDYFSLNFMLLLNQGVYRRKTYSPLPIKKMLSSAFADPSGQSVEELAHCFGRIWEPIPSVNHVESIIASLTLRYIYQKNLSISRSLLDDIIASFLLVKDQALINRISLRIVGLEEKKHGFCG